MKKALALTLMLVLGLSFGLIAADFSVGDLSGTWETEFSIGYTDVIITDPGATLIIPGGTYTVTEGFVTIPDQLVSGTYLGDSYTVTHPGGTYTVGPWSVSVLGGTYNVTLGSVTIPDQTVTGTYQGTTYTTLIPGDTYTVGPWSITIPAATYDVTVGTVVIPVQTITVALPDGTVEVTLPAHSFTIPDFLNKECDIDWDDDYAAVNPVVSWTYGGIQPYFAEVTGGIIPVVAPYDSTVGVTTVPIQSGLLGVFDWCLLEFAPSTTGVLATAFSRDIQVPIGAGLFETVTFTFTPAAYTPDHDDFVNGLVVTLVDTQTDSLTRTWTATITVTYLIQQTVFPTVDIAAGTVVGTCVYDNKTLAFETSVAISALVAMPPGWPFPFDGTTPCYDPRPTVSFGYDNQGWVHENVPMGEPMGPCLLDFPLTTFDVNDTGFAEVDMLGNGLFATFEDGTQTVTLPAQTLTGTYVGGSVDITIPSQTVTVSGQTVSIPAISFTVPADSITIPDYTFDIVVADQVISITIPGGTYDVSAQTVTIPSQTITVPADTIVIPDFSFTITVADQIIPITIAGGTYNVYSASLQTVTIPSQTVLVPGWSQTVTDVLTLGVESTLTVDYLISGWLFGMVLVVDETGMTALDFSAGGALGAFTISSTLGFDPALVAFEKWNVITGVSIAGVTLGADFTLVPNDVSLLLSGSGVAGDISIAVDVSFGIPANELCDLSWAGVDIEIGIPFYCAELDMTLAFDCEGFDSLTFSVTGIAVPSFPWITISADLTFTVDAKTLVISPDVSFGAGVCIDLYMDLGYAGEGPLTVTDFTIYGIGIVADFGGGVTFTGLSSFDEVNFDLILDPYWEVYTIATTDDGCCGPFNFDVSVYFLEGGVRLFDIAYLEANMSLQVAAQLEFTTGVELDIENEDFTLWTIGLNVSW